MFENSDTLQDENYANRAYVRCFQVTKDHNDGNYNDVIADASKALIQDCENIRTRCIRAYGYYLNNNYDDAINDCDKIIERAACDIEAKKKKMKEAWETACKAMTAAAQAQAAAAAAEQAAETAVNAAEQAQADYCASLQNAAFAYELLGMIYTTIDMHLEASRNYKLAMLACQAPSRQTGNQTDISMPGPLLMDAYRNARRAVKGI